MTPEGVHENVLSSSQALGMIPEGRHSNITLEQARQVVLSRWIIMLSYHTKIKIHLDSKVQLNLKSPPGVGDPKDFECPFSF